MLGRHCHAVSGGSERVYRLVARDAGSRIRVVVTASNPRRLGVGMVEVDERRRRGRRWPATASSSAAASGAPAATTSGSASVRSRHHGVRPGVGPNRNMPWNDLTQVVLFALQTQNGPGRDHLITDIDVPAWVAAAHAHGVTPFISIGGSDDQNWHNACNDTNRAQFVQNLVNYATSNGFDGIDLDPEDQVWGAQNPPVQAMTDCIVGVSNAAHAVGLLVSADVITNWEGPWFAPSQAYVDQFNLMTYGDNLATMQSDVQDTINQGLPASKFVASASMSTTIRAPLPGGCGQFSNYAAQAGLKGAFLGGLHRRPARERLRERSRRGIAAATTGSAERDRWCASGSSIRANPEVRGVSRGRA